MNRISRSVLYILFTTLAWFPESTLAQTTQESMLISHLVQEASEPGAHGKEDVYLRVTLGDVHYVAELKTGKVISQQKAENSSGGLCSNYVEVSLNLLDKDQQLTSQGASQILRFSRDKWTRIALSEGYYACEKLKRIPKSVIACLKIECN